jgi:hypothetical protein
VYTGYITIPCNSGDAMSEQHVNNDEQDETGLDETELEQVSGGGVVVHERRNEQNDKLRAEQDQKASDA